MSTNTLPDLAGPNQSFDSSEAVLQRLDSLLAFISQVPTPLAPRRAEDYQRVLNQIRHHVHNHGKLLQKMRQVLSHIEANLQAHGWSVDPEKGV